MTSPRAATATSTCLNLRFTIDVVYINMVLFFRTIKIEIYFVLNTYILIFFNILMILIFSFPWNISEIGYDYSSQLKRLLADGDKSINAESSKNYFERNLSTPTKDVETERNLNNEVFFCSPSLISTSNSPTILSSKPGKVTDNLKNNNKLSWKLKLNELGDSDCIDTPIWQSQSDATKKEYSSESLKSSYF